MKGHRYFISGGAGVIGRELVPLLSERGAAVLVGDLKPRPDIFAREVQYRQGDLNSLSRGELQAFSPDVFIHLAATFERSVESYGFWEENFWHNVRLSHHLMSVAKDLPSMRRVVFASSYLIYDPTLYQFNLQRSTAVALKEVDPVMPRNLTGMAKLAHEIELRFIEGFRTTALSTVCARIFRGYGRNSRDVISRWIRALLAGESISVFRPEGLFDYIYARDAAEGLSRLADNEAVKGVVNLGTGRARRVADVLAILRSHFPNMEVTHSPSDIPFEASQADMSVFAARIGWVPGIQLEQAIEEMISFEKAKGTSVRPPRLEVGHVLVTSASRKVPLVRAVQDAARKLHPDMKVIAGDSNENALAFHAADSIWRMPAVTEVEVEALIAGCGERGIRTIVPTRDGELLFWAEHGARFADAGISIVISPSAAVRTCLDKLEFAAFGKRHGMPFIPTGARIEDVDATTYVVKERYGAGSRNLGLDLTHEAALDHAKSLEFPVFQPFVAGQEISVDAWLNKVGKVKGLVLRRRDRIVAGESQVTTTFRDGALETAIVGMLEALDLRGPVVMQLLVDPEGRMHVIECNARFGGASTASIAAGLDVFYWSLLEAQGADLEEYPFQRIPGELRQIRVPSDIIVHGHHF